MSTITNSSQVRPSEGFSMRASQGILEFLSFVLSRPDFLFGLVIVVVTLFLAAFGPLIAPYPPEFAIPGGGLLPPSAAHWMGTDVSGMDIFSRVISAPRIDLTIAILSTFIAFSVGVILGVISGFFAGIRGFWGLIGELIIRTSDIVQAFPIFIFALALVCFRGPGIQNVILALSFLNIPYFMRVTRGMVLAIRERPLVEAARCVGNSELRIAFAHVMPNSLTPALANVSSGIGNAILLTAGLSFVGAGVPKPTPEWGSMIAIGAPNMMTGQWWTALLPGIVLGLTIFGYALAGDGFQSYFNPLNRR